VLSLIKESNKTSEENFEHLKNILKVIEEIYEATNKLSQEVDKFKV